MMEDLVTGPHGNSVMHPGSLPGPTPEEEAAGRLAGKDLEIGTKIWVKYWLHRPPAGIYCWLPGFVASSAGYYRDAGLVKAKVIVRRAVHGNIFADVYVQRFPVALRFTGPADLEEARRLAERLPSLPMELPGRHTD